MAKGKIGALLCVDCGCSVGEHFFASEQMSVAFRLEGCFLTPSEVQLVRHIVIQRVRRGR